MKTSILHALSERSFLYLWLGEIFTQIAVNLFNFFLILIVFQQTHSNTAVSGTVISFIIPPIIFGSLAGVYVDRWDKKKVLIVTNFIRALLLILLAFFIRNLVVIYLFSFAVALLTQFFIPAETPIIPLVVEEKNLLSANALFGMGIYGSILIAYVLSGPLIILAGTTGTLVVLAFMLLIGAAIISFVSISPAKKRTEAISNIARPNIFHDIRHTLSIVSRTREIYHSLLLLALSQILILIVATIAPGYATQILGIQVEQFPLLFVAPAALGMVVGAVILVNMFHSHPKERIINTGIFLSGAAMLLLPYGSKVASRGFIQVLNAFLPHILLINILHIMVVLAFILGIANSFVFVPANTLIQEKTTDEFRGKIYGFLNTIVGALSLFPIIVVGGLSDIIGVGTVISGIGISLLLLGIIRMLMI